MDIQTRGQWLPVALMATFGAAAFFMRDMISSILGDRASLNAVGIGAVILLTGLAFAGLVSINRARKTDSFRGAFSELLRLAAFAAVALVIGLWVMTVRG